MAKPVKQYISFGYFKYNRGRAGPVLCCAMAAYGAQPFTLQLRYTGLYPISGHTAIAIERVGDHFEIATRANRAPVMVIAVDLIAPCKFPKWYSFVEAGSIVVVDEENDHVEIEHGMYAPYVIKTMLRIPGPVDRYTAWPGRDRGLDERWFYVNVGTRTTGTNMVLLNGNNPDKQQSAPFEVRLSKAFAGRVKSEVYSARSDVQTQMSDLINLYNADTTSTDAEKAAKFLVALNTRMEEMLEELPTTVELPVAGDIDAMALSGIKFDFFGTRYINPVGFEATVKDAMPSPKIDFDAMVASAGAVLPTTPSIDQVSELQDRYGIRLPGSYQTLVPTLISKVDDYLIDAQKTESDINAAVLTFNAKVTANNNAAAETKKNEIDAMVSEIDRILNQAYLLYNSVQSATDAYVVPTDKTKAKTAYEAIQQIQRSVLATQTKVKGDFATLGAATITTGANAINIRAYEQSKIALQRIKTAETELSQQLEKALHTTRHNVVTKALNEIKNLKPGDRLKDMENYKKPTNVTQTTQDAIQLFINEGTPVAVSIETVQTSDAVQSSDKFKAHAKLVKDTLTDEKSKLVPLSTTLDGIQTQLSTINTLLGSSKPTLVSLLRSARDAQAKVLDLSLDPEVSDSVLLKTFESDPTKPLVSDLYDLNVKFDTAFKKAVNEAFVLVRDLEKATGTTVTAPAASTSAVVISKAITTAKQTVKDVTTGAKQVERIRDSLKSTLGPTTDMTTAINKADIAVGKAKKASEEADLLLRVLISQRTNDASVIQAARDIGDEKKKVGDANADVDAATINYNDAVRAEAVVIATQNATDATDEYNNYSPFPLDAVHSNEMKAAHEASETALAKADVARLRANDALAIATDPAKSVGEVELAALEAKKEYGIVEKALAEFGRATAEYAGAPRPISSASAITPPPSTDALQIATQQYNLIVNQETSVCDNLKKAYNAYINTEGIATHLNLINGTKFDASFLSTLKDQETKAVDPGTVTQIQEMVQKSEDIETFISDVKNSDIKLVRNFKGKIDELTQIIADATTELNACGMDITTAKNDFNTAIGSNDVAALQAQLGIVTAAVATLAALNITAATDYVWMHNKPSDGVTKVIPDLYKPADDFEAQLSALKTIADTIKADMETRLAAATATAATAVVTAAIKRFTDAASVVAQSNKGVNDIKLESSVDAAEFSQAMNDATAKYAAAKTAAHTADAGIKNLVVAVSPMTDAAAIFAKQTEADTQTTNAKQALADAQAAKNEFDAAAITKARADANAAAGASVALVSGKTIDPVDSQSTAQMMADHAEARDSLLKATTADNEAQSASNNANAATVITEAEQQAQLAVQAQKIVDGHIQTFTAAKGRYETGLQALVQAPAPPTGPPPVPPTGLPAPLVPAPAPPTGPPLAPAPAPTTQPTEQMKTLRAEAAGDQTTAADTFASMLQIQKSVAEFVPASDTNATLKATTVANAHKDVNAAKVPTNAVAAAALEAASATTEADVVAAAEKAKRELSKVTDQFKLLRKAWAELLNDYVTTVYVEVDDFTKTRNQTENDSIAKLAAAPVSAEIQTARDAMNVKLTELNAIFKDVNALYNSASTHYTNDDVDGLAAEQEKMATEFAKFTDDFKSSVDEKVNAFADAVTSTPGSDPTIIAGGAFTAATNAADKAKDLLTKFTSRYASQKPDFQNAEQESNKATEAVKAAQDALKISGDTTQTNTDRLAAAGVVVQKQKEAEAALKETQVHFENYVKRVRTEAEKLILENVQKIGNVPKLVALDQASSSDAQKKYAVVAEKLQKLDGFKRAVQMTVPAENTAATIEAADEAMNASYNGKAAYDTAFQKYEKALKAYNKAVAVPPAPVLPVPVALSEPVTKGLERIQDAKKDYENIVEEQTRTLGAIRKTQAQTQVWSEFNNLFKGNEFYVGNATELKTTVETKLQEMTDLEKTQKSEVQTVLKKEKALETVWTDAIADLDKFAKTKPKKKKNKAQAQTSKQQATEAVEEANKEKTKLQKTHEQSLQTVVDNANNDSSFTPPIPKEVVIKKFVSNLQELDNDFKSIETTVDNKDQKVKALTVKANKIFAEFEKTDTCKQQGDDFGAKIKSLQDKCVIPSIKKLTGGGPDGGALPPLAPGTPLKTPGGTGGGAAGFITPVRPPTSVVLTPVLNALISDNQVPGSPTKGGMPKSNPSPDKKPDDQLDAPELLTRYIFKGIAESKDWNPYMRDVWINYFFQALGRGEDGPVNDFFVRQWSVDPQIVDPQVKGQTVTEFENIKTLKDFTIATYFKMVEFVKNSTALVLFGKHDTFAATAGDPLLKDAVFSLPFVRNKEGDYSEVVEFLIDSLFWFGHDQLMMNENGEFWGGSYLKCVDTANTIPSLTQDRVFDPKLYKQNQTDIPQLTTHVMGGRALQHALKEQSFIRTDTQTQKFVREYTRYAVRTKSFQPGSDVADKFKKIIRDENDIVTGFNAANQRGRIDLTTFKTSFIPSKIFQSF